MTLEDSQNKFIDLMRGLRTVKEKNQFLKWIHSNWNLDNLEEDDNSQMEILNSIAEELRCLVPLSSALFSENINLPTCGPNSDCESKTTIHVDEFLYDEDYVNELVDQGQLSRYYCGKCFSKDTKLLTFISHSMSVSRVHYLFKCLLPPLTTETILDVGSRLGPVLYGAYVYTSCPKIIGVEINPEFCELQSTIIKKYKFDDKIQIICNNICNELNLLSFVDVIILNNVFEFFADASTVITSWQILAQNIKPGCLLITIPSLKNTFKHFKVNFNWKDWVEEVEPYQKDFISDETDEHYKNVKQYRVKKKM